MPLRVTAHSIGLWRIWERRRTAEAQLTWDVHPTHWNINFLQVNRPRDLVWILAKFRTVWRARGRPALTCEIRAPHLHRLLGWLASERDGDHYGIANLDVVRGGALRFAQASGGRHGEEDRS